MDVPNRSGWAPRSLTNLSPHISAHGVGVVAEQPKLTGLKSESLATFIGIGTRQGQRQLDFRCAGNRRTLSLEGNGSSEDFRKLSLPKEG